MPRSLTAWLTVTACLVGQPAQSTMAQRSRHAVVALPASGGDNVSRRQVSRLQDVLDAATEDRSAGAPTSLGARTVRRCNGDRGCLLGAAREMGAARVLASQLDRDGETMRATMAVLDPSSGSVISESSVPVASRYRLRGVAEGLLESSLAAAHAGVEAAEATDTGAREPAEAAAEARGTSIAGGIASARAKSGGSSAPGYANSTPRPEQPWAGDDGAPPLPGTQTGEAFEAKKAARDRSPRSFTGPVGAAPRKGLDWREHLSRMRSKARQDDGSGRGVLLGLYLGLATISFLLGIAAVSVFHAVGRVAKETLATSDPLGAKKLAENQALLRSCCKQLTPGIIMSTEFETVRHFHFALLDGKELSIHVTDYQDADESAFRPGAMVCVQFSHERRACVAMMLVKRARNVRGQMRVQLRVPEHLADIVLPRHFHVPVDDRIGLVAQVVLEQGEERLSFVSRVSDMSSETLSLKVDGDTPELPLSCMVKVSLRLQDARADITAKYEGLEGGKVMLRVLPELAGTKPSLAYKELFQRIEAAWVSPAA